MDPSTSFNEESANPGSNNNNYCHQCLFVNSHINICKERRSYPYRFYITPTVILATAMSTLQVCIRQKLLRPTLLHINVRIGCVWLYNKKHHKSGFFYLEDINYTSNLKNRGNK